MPEVLVIGGGAAGLMAAVTAAKNGGKVVLLERNEKVGRKIMITGKGRCNVTNDCADLNALISAVPVNGRFLYSAFSRFMPADTMNFFESQRVPLKTERGNRVFPESDRASDIVDALFFAAKHAGVDIVTGKGAYNRVRQSSRRDTSFRRADICRQSDSRHRRQVLSPDGLNRRRI